MLKSKLKNEGFQTITNRNGLKMKASDGKMRVVALVTTKDLLRIIQSVPSKKAEPLKIWLADIGNERLNETQNPELTIERAMKEYHDLGYSEVWINARLQSIKFRKELADEWKNKSINEDPEFGILTNILTKEWSGKNIKKYMEFKGLKKQNLRDNMTSLELALYALAEVTATEISKTDEAIGMNA